MPTGREIVELLDVSGGGPSRFQGRQPTRSTLDKLYGGQLFAQAAAAARLTVPRDRRLHTVQALCLEAGDHGAPVDYHVERVRDGRSFSARAVVATQGDREVVRLTASFHVPEPGLSHATPVPSVALPETLPTIQEVVRDLGDLPPEPWEQEWAGLDVRYVVTPRTGRRHPGPGRQQIWIRVVDRLPDDPDLHRLVVTYLSDITLLNASLVPHGLVLGAPDLPRATLNHAVWLHDDARADEWLLVDQVSPRATGARGLASAEVFTADGRHVASFVQEGLIRPRGPLRHTLGVS